MKANSKKVSNDGSRRGLVATVAAVVFAVSGVGLIGVSIASQREAPQPPATGGLGTALAGAVQASESWLTTNSIRSSENTVGPILPRSKPVTLDIPTIGVHSVVQDLGQAADGTMEAPAPGAHYNEAAWYRHSPTPGSLGPAIMLGHVDSAAEGPSVFFRLGELKAGDRLSVTRADDSTAVFLVDEVARYSKDNFPTKLVYGDINFAGLRIVTCGGAFDNSTGHYLDNIVVFASLVDSPGIAQE